MPNKIEFGPVDIGELDHVLHNQGVSDLSWLSVNEEEYRAQETLPKQNLDIVPELQKALSFGPDESVPHLIPLKPHPIVNTNPSDIRMQSDINVDVPINNRVAALVIKGHKPEQIRERLSLEFSPVDLRLASEQTRSTIEERGLLGNVYIRADHFPRCNQRDEQSLRLVGKHASKSLFVIASSKCTDCVCNNGGNCTIFKKTLVSKVAYSQRLASHYFPDMEFPSDPDGIRVALQRRFLESAPTPKPDGVKTIATHHQVPKRTYSDAEINSAVLAPKERPVTLSSGYIKYSKRMMNGKDDRAFLIASGDDELTKLASEYGVLGHSYLDMDALGGCRNTLAHIQSTGIRPVYVLRRAGGCEQCRCTSDGYCSKISKYSTILNSAVYDRKMLASALANAVRTNRMASDSARNVAQNVTESTDLRGVISSVNLYTPQVDQTAQYRSTSYKRFSGSGPDSERPDETELSIFISKLLNDGLTGSKLSSAILSRYSQPSLREMKHVSDRFASEVGIQGHYYIDPTAYSDYGHGCSEGASRFRKRGPLNILASSACTGCTLQTSPGWCSKYCKTMIRSVPDSIRSASMEAKNVSGHVEQPVVGDPVSEFGLSKDLAVDTNGFKSSSIDINMPNSGIDG